MPRHAAFRCAALLAAAMTTGCASLEAANDWWSVRATGQGTEARLHSTSHVNHGRPPRDRPVEPRLLREETRGAVSVAVHRDAALETWVDAGWTFGRELDKALDWLARVAGEDGARLVVTLVDDEHALHVDRVHAARPPVVELHVAVDDAVASRSAVVGRALGKGLHEIVHAVSATTRPTDDRLAEERHASLVEACYLLDTIRPGDTLALNASTGHPGTDNFAILQSRAAAAATIGELRRIAGSTTLQAGDRAVRDALRRRCAQAGRSGR